MADNEAWTPDDYKVAIRKLQEEEAKLSKLLKDPEEREKRWQRRAQILGDWATPKFNWSDDQIAELRKAAGDEEELFEPKLLELDGWTRTKQGQWRAPPSA